VEGAGGGDCSLTTAWVCGLVRGVSRARLLRPRWAMHCAPRAGWSFSSSIPTTSCRWRRFRRCARGTRRGGPLAPVLLLLQVRVLEGEDFRRQSGVPDFRRSRGVSTTTSPPR
jgi:hypothetical protein